MRMQGEVSHFFSYFLPYSTVDDLHFRLDPGLSSPVLPQQQQQTSLPTTASQNQGMELLEKTFVFWTKQCCFIHFHM